MPATPQLFLRCPELAGQGAFSTAPEWVRGDRDLDGDGRDEVVLSDRALCTDAGNCYWNLFTESTEKGRCFRYLGTVAGRRLERLSVRSGEGFYEIRSWWGLADGARISLEHYRYIGDAYRVVGAAVCRRTTADRVKCADSQR